VVTVCFWTGSPVNHYRRTDRFMAVERLLPGRDSWQIVREDFDWDKTVRWKQIGSEADGKAGKDSRTERDRLGPVPRVARPDSYQVTITWQTDAQTAPGTYRIVHYGRFKTNGRVERFVAASRPFEVKSQN
jgi:neutral ceramidase